MMDNPISEAGYVLVKQADYDAAVARAEQLQEQADCGGTNCGKCQQCLTVNLHFALEAVKNLEARAEQAVKERDEAEELSLERLGLYQGAEAHVAALEAAGDSLVGAVEREHGTRLCVTEMAAWRALRAGTVPR